MIPRALNVLTTLGIFVFFAAMFAVPSGYSYGGVLLLITSLWYLAGHPPLGLDADDRRIVGVLLVYFVVATGMTLSLGNNVKDLDQYGRALLAVPILLLFCSRIPIQLPAVWVGMTLGGILSVPLAWWQVTVVADTQAGGFMNKISFSNLAFVFAAFCLAGVFWALLQTRHRSAWCVLLMLGAAAAFYSAVVGGSRGTWLAVPPVAVLFLVAFLNQKNAVRMLGSMCVLVALLVALFALPGSALRVRYEEGRQNVSAIHQGDDANSIGARLEIWRAAWMNLQKKPVQGWNMQDYAAAVSAEVSQGKVAPIASHYMDNLHNNYFQAWVFTGLPGLLALLALYCVPLWHFVRRLRDSDLTVRVLAFCGSSLVVSFMCFSLTYSALRRNYGIMFYLLCLVVFWGAMKQARREATTWLASGAARSNT